MTRLKTLSRREQRQIDRQIREHFAEHPPEMAPELAEMFYVFVMAWQPDEDNDNELWRSQLSDLVETCMEWAFLRGKEQGR